jgi:hypothetical protein
MRDDVAFNYDITVSAQECGLDDVYRGFPSVGNPAGTYVWTVDELWARPETSTTWHMDTVGDYYYNGTHGAVYDWYDYKTGQVDNGGNSLTAMNDWTINPGWYVSIVQYVWVNGTWFSSVPPEGCAF